MLLDLFTWWIISISWSIVFLIVVGIYLYAGSRSRREEEERQTKWKPTRQAGQFMVLWVLLGLLAFYIVSVNLGSATFFAAGNIIVEIVLIIHTVKNRSKES